MRAASPPGQPCPPSWGQRAAGTADKGEMVPAGMAGGTPRRTCSGAGDMGLRSQASLLQPTQGNSPLLSTGSFWRQSLLSLSPTGWMGTIGLNNDSKSPLSHGLLGPSATPWNWAELQLWLSRTCAGLMALFPARALVVEGGQAWPACLTATWYLHLRGLRGLRGSTGDPGDPPPTKLWGVKSLTMVRGNHRAPGTQDSLDGAGPKRAREHQQPWNTAPSSGSKGS